MSAGLREVPDGRGVSGGAGGCAPHSAPPGARGRALPRPADTLARPGPAHLAVAAAGSGSGGSDTHPPSPLRRVVVRWRKDGGGHRVSGGGGPRRRARAVSAAAASSHPAPGRTGSRLGGHRGPGGPHIPSPSAPAGEQLEAPFPSFGGLAASPRHPLALSVPPRLPGTCGPPRQAGLWAPADLRCAPRPQFPPSFPSCSRAPSCQQTGLRIIPRSPHFLRGTWGLPSFPWCQPVPAPLPSSLHPFPVSPCVFLISRQACRSLQPLLHWGSLWAPLFPLVPPTEVSLPSALLCHLLPFQRHLCTSQRTPVLPGGFPLSDPSKQVSWYPEFSPQRLCVVPGHMCALPLWQDEDEVEL